MERSDHHHSVPNLRSNTIMEEEEKFEKRSSGDTKPSYSILNEAQIRQRQEDDITRVSTTLSQSRAVVIVMLRHFNWNLSKFLDNWFDDELGVRTKLGLFATPIVARVSSDSPITCGICLDTFRYSPDPADSAVASASCGHLYCRACWSSYIANSMNDDGPGCLMLTCPDPSCVAAVGEDMIGALAMNHSDKEKFSRYLLRSYIEDSYRRKKIKWCPAPNCNYAVDFTSYFVGDGEIKSFDVNCRCSHSYCWSCGEEIHRPVGCEMVAKWMAKCSDESENANWILVNTKACPKCRRPIEKNQGCNHMRCAAPCRHEFCWHCLGEWSVRSFHSCNRFLREGALDEAEVERRSAVKESLKKYGHYYKRWAGNLRSRQKAVEDVKALQNEGLDRLGMYYGQQKEFFGFIVEAWQQIIRCRRVLQWSYVYGYNFPDDQKEKKQFFEYLQGEAEFSLERLHNCVELELVKYLDAEGTVNEFLEYRRKVSELTCVIGNYFENLVKALEDGLSEVTPLPRSCDVCSCANSLAPRCYMCYNHPPRQQRNHLYGYHQSKIGMQRKSLLQLAG